MPNKLNSKIGAHTSRLSLLFTGVLAILLCASIGTYLVFKGFAAASDADFNNDATINIYDLSILASNWGKNGITHAQGDANNDGIVNIYDLSLVASYWGQTVTLMPTPSLTLWDGAGPDPNAVYTNSGPLKLNNVHDLVYENVRFSGSSPDAESGVIWIMNSYNITFRNCIIETNGNGIGNGVTIFDGGNGIHDITFDHCHFEYQPRMGIEIISRRADRGAGNFPGYLRVNLTNNTLDAQGSEAISYDDDDPSHTYNNQPQGAGYSVISGNEVKGAGINSAYPWRRSFEINRTRNMTVTGNYFGPGVDGITNLRQTLGDPTPVNWTFSNNTWDATSFLSGITYKAGSQLWYMANIQGGGVTVTDTMKQSAPYSIGSWGYLDSVNGADFSGSTINGMAGQLSPGMSPNSFNILWPTRQ